MTPDAIAAYAALHLTTDDGRPIIPAAHHALWLQLLADWRIKKLLIVAPPESAKSTWVVSAYLGLRIGMFPQQSVIIAASTETVAEKRSQSLRTMTESLDWQATFPGIKRARGMKWDAVEWSLAPDGLPTLGRLHPTVAGYGTGGSITGSRADEIVADDLLDFDNTRTAHQRDLVRTWVHNSLLPRRKSQVGRIVVIGTAYHYGDFYQEIRGAPDWVVCHTPLLTEGVDVYAILTYPDSWAYEMLGEPIAGANL